MNLTNYRRQNLLRIVKLFTIFIGLVILYITFDFFSVTTSDEVRTQKFRITLPPLEVDKAYFFKVDNKQIVIVRYSKALQQSLHLTSEAPEYFVAYAFGTYLGCPLQVIDHVYLKETCSSALYDFAGKPVKTENFPALQVPVYNFCPDFSCINLHI